MQTNMGSSLDNMGSNIGSSLDNPDSSLDGAGSAASYAYAARYLYSDTVVMNDNFLRLSARQDAFQTPLSSSIATTPAARLIQYNDRLGNPTHRLRLTAPHDRLVILAIGSVRLRNAPAAPADIPIPDLAYDADCEDYLTPTPMVAPERVADAARAIVGAPQTLLHSVQSVVDWVYSNITYIRGSTTVATTAEQVLASRQGVCQDMTHLSLGMLRALGIPARYCSGLLSVDIGETHAWLEFLHPQLGWLPSDPTRGLHIASNADLVKFAVGRDYTQASPIEGTFVSTGSGWLDITAAQVIRSPQPVSFDDALNLIENPPAVLQRQQQGIAPIAPYEQNPNTQ